MANIMGDNILDDLLPIVDELRGDLNTLYGTRSHRCFIEIRTYEGQRHDGYFTVSSTEILPIPKVLFTSDHFNMNGAGKYSEGNIEISEISLVNYSSDDLSPRNLLPNQKLLYRLVDAHNESMPDRFFLPNMVPVIDREFNEEWHITCHEIQISDLSRNGPR